MHERRCPSLRQFACVGQRAGMSPEGSRVSPELRCVQMNTDRELEEVEIEFWVDWYDGPVSGVATHEGQAYWFEAEPGFEPVFIGRKLPEEMIRSGFEACAA